MTRTRFTPWMQHRRQATLSCHLYPISAKTLATQSMSSSASVSAQHVLAGHCSTLKEHCNGLSNEGQFSALHPMSTSARALLQQVLPICRASEIKSLLGGLVQGCCSCCGLDAACPPNMQGLRSFATGQHQQHQQRKQQQTIQRIPAAAEQGAVGCGGAAEGHPASGRCRPGAQELLWSPGPPVQRQPG